MAQPIRKRKRLWTNVSAPTPQHPNGRRETKYKETVTILPEPTQAYRDGYDRIFGKREP